MPPGRATAWPCPAFPKKNPRIRRYSCVAGNPSLPGQVCPRVPYGKRGQILASAVNKRKSLEAAQKFIQKGALDKALKEYSKLLRADPLDTNIRLKIGDLHVKRGETDQAIQTYVQVAEQFSKAGFDAKAVAIYKQILHIDASCLNAHVRLGDLFQRMGLTSDALREFQKGIQVCEERGLKREAFDLLKRVASLDPSNVPNRLRLALLLLRQDLHDEAREEYASLLKQVIDGDEPELTTRVCEQMLESFPDAPEAWAGLGRAKVGLGEIEEAITLLTKALPRFSDDIAVREALVFTYEAAGDEAGVQLVQNEMAEIYKARGDHEQASAILQRFANLDDLAEPDTAPSIILSEVLGEEAGASIAPERLSSSPERQPLPDIDQSPEDLLAEARISFEFGDMKGAQARLETLLEKRPGHTGAQELLAQLQGHSGGHLVLDTTADSTVEEMDDSQFTVVTERADPANGPDDFLDLGTIPQNQEDTLPDIELMLEDDQDTDERFASVDPPREVQEAELEIDLDTSDSLESETPSAAADEESTGISVDLDEAEFFFSHGMLDEAERAYRDILNRAPQNPKAMLRMGEIEQARREAGSAESVAEPDLAPSEAAPSVARNAPEEDSFDLAAELESSSDKGAGGVGEQGFEEVFRAFKREIQEQIGEDESETHYDLAIAYKEMGLLEDAVAELEIVIRAGQMPLHSFAILLSTCKIGLELPHEAASVLQDALDSGEGDEATEVSLRYELGESLLAAGQSAEALDAYRKVAASDPEYREVGARIKQLK